MTLLLGPLTLMWMWRRRVDDMAPTVDVDCLLVYIPTQQCASNDVSVLYIRMCMCALLYFDFLLRFYQPTWSNFSVLLAFAAHTQRHFPTNVHIKAKNIRMQTREEREKLRKTPKQGKPFEEKSFYLFQENGQKKRLCELGSTEGMRIPA